jgi:hypothetical protein
MGPTGGRAFERENRHAVHIVADIVIGEANSLEIAPGELVIAL